MATAKEFQEYLDNRDVEEYAISVKAEHYPDMYGNDALKMQKIISSCFLAGKMQEREYPQLELIHSVITFMRREPYVLLFSTLELAEKVLRLRRADKLDDYLEKLVK